MHAVADILLDKNIEREILNHRRLSHTNILGFREVFTTDTHLGIVVRSTLIFFAASTPSQAACVYRPTGDLMARGSCLSRCSSPWRASSTEGVQVRCL